MEPQSVRLITAAQLAQVLATSTDHVYRLSETGAIPTVRVGRKVRFDPTDVIAHLNTQGIPT